MTKRHVTQPLAALAALGCLAFVASPARAGAPVVASGNARVVEESALVVWDGASKVEHLLVAAHLVGDAPAGHYLFALPAAAASIEPPLPGAVPGFAKLLTGASPLPFAGQGAAALSLPFAGPPPCQALSLVCGKAVAGWAEEARSAGKAVIAVGLSPGSAGESESPYVHLSFDALSAVVPFSEPPEAASYVDQAPPPPSKEHPPRVKLWVELGTETKTGAWERAMDAAVEAESDDLSSCYAKLLEKSPRLSGDLHVQMRLAPDGGASSQGERASSKPVGKVADCFAPLLEKAAWPKLPGRALPFEVHALLRPPVASPRVARVFLLSSLDAEAHMGSEADPRVPPDARLVASFEPSPRELLAAFDRPTRLALGIDANRRWRALLIESLADPHGPGDEIVFRAVADLPPPRPGEAPLPIVERGDRPAAWAPPDKRPPRWRGRRARVVFALLAGAGLLAWLLLREQHPGLAKRG